MKQTRSKDHLKAKDEREAFKSFALAACLEIDPRSIESREPPEPDILCVGNNGQQIAFELTRVCHEEIKKFYGDSIKCREVAAQFNWVDASQIRKIIASKLCKSYESDCPIDLLCYAEYLVTPDDIVVEEIQCILNEKGYGPFQSVWFHGEGVVKKFG